MDRQSTTFILMKILRDVNYNTNQEAREHQRRFVNERFQRSNTNLGRSIISSASSLNELISDFSDIFTSIEQSKARVENIRERLRECKNLLLLKRQDIRKLWLLASEQNSLVRIYQNLDELKHVPIRLRFYLSKRLYIHASLLLIKAREHQELRLINALSNLDLQIRDERLSLEEQLCFELIDQLFDKPGRDILGNKQLPSSNTIIINKHDQNSLSRLRENRLLRKQLDHDFEEGRLSFESHLLSIIPDKYMLVDIRYQAPDLYIDVLLQSLSILSHLNETLEFVQKQLHEQFYRIILRTTQHIIDNNFTLSNNSLVNNPDCLRELLETCYEQFKLVVKNIEYLLNMLKLIQEHQAPLQIQQKEYFTSLKQHDLKSGISIPNEVHFEIPFRFPIELVWETLQQVLSDVLYEYIDYNNTLDTLTSSSSSTSMSTDYANHPSLMDFSQYLTKKGPPRSQQIPRVFEFAQSAQFNSMTTYLQEQNRFVIKQDPLSSSSSITKIPSTTYKQYVCKPNYRNVTTVHDVLRRIIEDIDNNQQLHPTKRILDRNLTEFIRDRFIGRVIKDIRESAQLSSSSSSTLADQNRLVELIPLVLQKQLQLPVPILQSTYLIFKSCEELCALVKCLPPYADDFCQAIADLLFKHRESCNKLFLSIVEKNETSTVSIYSNEWVKDPDINRHLRTMPAFDAFIRLAKQQYNDKDDDNVENIRFRQTKETETLLINFSQSEMNLDDICTNYKHIKVLATIHESLDWLYCKLLQYFDILDKCLTDVKYLDGLTQTITVTSGFTPRSIKQNLSHYEQLKLSRINLEILSNAMKTTLTLSYDILLVLFLEIRLHCFYHLSLLFRNATHYAYVLDTDPDENVMALNRDLTCLQEALNSTLTEKKFSFLFQGLGFVLSTILIRSAPRFQRINELGVTKMCRNIFAIEQTLSQIQTVGDAELMRAHQYYELLYATKPEEIIDVIEEHGPEYSEQDYLHLLQLQHRSFRESERGNFDLNKYEQLIKQALRPKS